MDRVDATRNNIPLALTNIYSRIIGSKSYELTDHLGNVRAVVSDIKLPSGMNFTADLKSSTEYYPFGMAVPTRGYQSAEYRYGYNGKEKDDEVKGEGNSYDYGARIYDSRLGRWLSVDPEERNAPAWTPYRAFFNNPIRNTDQNGRYETDGHYWTVRLVATLLKLKDAKDIAFWAEAPDHIMTNNGTSSIPTNTWVDAFYSQKHIHALTGESSDQVRVESRYELSMARNSRQRGLASHRLGDSYAHTIPGTNVMFGSPFGHARENFMEESKRPDLIKNRPKLYLMYVSDLSNTLQEAGYGEPKKKTIDMFTFTYIANGKFTTEVNMEILRTEVLLQEGVKEFQILKQENYAIIADYLKVRNSHYKSNVFITTERESLDSNGRIQTQNSSVKN